MLNHLAEGSCYCYKIPDLPIDILFGFINKHECPEATEDDYYIIVWIGDYNKDRNVYRISLTEPKYIYNSDPLPVEYRDKVISHIFSNYTTGVNTINEYTGQILFDPRLIPNYNKL